LLIVASTVFFAGADALTKVLASSLPVPEIAWIRYVIFSLLTLPLLLRNGGVGVLRSGRPGLQLLRGLATVGSTLLFTASLQLLPVADATAINFVSPILITALSIPLLGAVVGWRRWVASAVRLGRRADHHPPGYGCIWCSGIPTPPCRSELGLRRSHYADDERHGSSDHDAYLHGLTGDRGFELSGPDRLDCPELE